MAKRNEITTYLPNYQFDSVYRKLASLHERTTAWLGNEEEGEYEVFIILGKFVDMSMTVAGPTHCWVTIDIEGQDHGNKYQFDYTNTRSAVKN